MWYRVVYQVLYIARYCDQITFCARVRKSIENFFSESGVKLNMVVTILLSLYSKLYLYSMVTVIYFSSDPVNGGEHKRSSQITEVCSTVYSAMFLSVVSVRRCSALYF